MDRKILKEMEAGTYRKPQKVPKTHRSFLMRILLFPIALGFAVFKNLEERHVEGKHRRLKAISLVFFFLGAVAFICMKNPLILAYFAGLVVLFSPMFLTRPAIYGYYRNFYTNPRGGTAEKNYFNQERFNQER